MGGVRAGEAIGQGISNQSALIEQKNKQAAVMNDVIGSLAPNASKDEVISRLTWISTHYPPDVMPPALINQAIRDLSNPASRSQRILEARDRAMGAEGVAKEAEILDPRTGERMSATEQTRQRAIADGAIPKTLPAGSEDAVKQYQEHLRRSSTYQQEVYPWQEAQKLIRELGPGSVGPGTENRHKLQSFVYSMFPETTKKLGLTKGMEEYAELEKYLTQGLQGRAEAYGSKSEAGLATAVAGTPNVHVNDLATDKLIQAQLAMRKYEQAQFLANQHHGQVGYAAKAADWAKNRDPRAYAFDVMTPEAIAKLDKSLKGPERAKFNATVKEGRKLGLIGDRAP